VRRRAIAFPLVLWTWVLPLSAGAQESLLEQWTVSALADRWQPWWEIAGGDGPQGTSSPRLRVESTAELLTLGSAMRQSSSGVTASIRQPLGARFSAIAWASSRRSISSAGGVSLQTPRTTAGAVGAVFRTRSDETPRAEIAALAGWNGKPGGWTRAGVFGKGGSVAVTGWAGGERQSRVTVLGDSLREIGATTEGQGLEVEGGFDLRLGYLRLRPAVSLGWESIGSVTPANAYFLVAATEGRASSSVFALAADGDAYGLEARYRTRAIAMGSPITRTEQAAGRLSFARIRYGSWSLEVRRRGDGRTLALDLAAERVEAGMSARLETWPYASLWEVIAAQALRLDGSLKVDAVRARLRSDPAGGGWGWSGSIARYELHSDRRSWYVTGLGFGRSGEEMAAAVVSPAYAIGGSLARPFTLGNGTVTATLSAELPIYAKQRGAEDPSPRSMTGFARIGLTWTQ
jgi:hypothetical protein